VAKCKITTDMLLAEAERIEREAAKAGEAKPQLSKEDQLALLLLRRAVKKHGGAVHAALLPAPARRKMVWLKNRGLVVQEANGAWRPVEA